MEGAGGMSGECVGNVRWVWEVCGQYGSERRCGRDVGSKRGVWGRCGYFGAFVVIVESLLSV